MGLTYAQSGVSVDRGNLFVQRIKPSVKATRIPGAIGTIGGFAGLFDVKKYSRKDSLLVSATDGVGTKLVLAQNLKKHNTVGIDLVAMSVNDLLAVGARPLFFLDYFATGKLSLSSATQVVQGIAKACREAGCALLGGETAEMPGFYAPGTYDLAGFAVGIVERKKMLPRRAVSGDALLGIASSGPHSNGYSLIRKVFSSRELKNETGRKLLKPTVIYVKPILKLLKKLPVLALVHVTGGGFIDNIPRVLSKGFSAKIQCRNWPIPQIFKLIQKKGKIQTREMFRTFNMGIGMIAILKERDVKKAKALLQREGLRSWKIGEVVKGRRVEIL